ncbi:MAG: FxLYD domain-containing protein [Acidimicrobiales bacterium]
MRRIVSITAAAAIGLVGCSGSSSNPAADDVKVASCTADATGSKPKAQGTITNATKKASTYSFRIRFFDGSGNEVTQAAAAVGKVEAGAMATWNAEGPASVKGPVTCKVANVSRTVTPSV